ncbi:PREDICTED: serine/threonine-protein kinase Nek11-like, partial [Priapulus caudatus]|uniref:non-specific serine/threonine protein kinase n=1 Tax=Priapulus caudatus TaxID=37621 RepID=A0ABM1DUY5_PRICU
LVVTYRNIFLKNNMIKIGDFGISRIMMGTSDLASTFIGTPYYMSPEVIRHAGYNSKSDIWSAGCILYEMCALRHAFDGTGLMGVMFAIVEGAMPKLPDKYSSSLADVLETMLRKDPAKRVSASEVLRIPYIAKHMQSLKQKMDQTRARGEGAARRPGGEGAAKMPGREGAERRPGREGAERRPGGEGVVKRPGGEGALRRPSGEGAPGRPGGDGAPGRLGGEGEPGRPRGDGAARRFGWEGRGGGAVAALTPMQRLQRKKQREADEAARQLSEAAAHNYSQNKERVQRLRTAQLSERPPWVEEHPEVFNSTAFQPQLPPSQQTRRGDSRAPPGRDSDDSDGIPEDPQLADTYYSQYDDFESSEEDDSDDEEEEIAEEPEVKKDDDRRGNRPGGHHRDDYGRLIHHMENALNLDASSGTFGDDVTVSQDTRIRNLKRQCDVVLGAEAFKKVYSYLRSARFQSSVSVTDEQVIRQLKRYCKNPADCFLVEQLLFLEEQARIDKL